MRYVAFATLVLVSILGCEGTSGSLLNTRKIVRKGEAWFSTKCGRISDCYEIAEKICPGGYKEDRDASREKELIFTCTAGNVNW